MLPRVLNGSKLAVTTGEALLTVSSLPDAAAPSRISVEGVMLVVAGVAEPELQMEETGFQLLVEVVLSADASHRPPAEGAVPTACHGSAAGGNGDMLLGLLVSHRLSWDTIGMSNPGHCSPAKFNTVTNESHVLYFSTQIYSKWKRMKVLLEPITYEQILFKNGNVCQENSKALHNRYL